MLKLYYKYHQNKAHTSIGLWRAINEKFEIESVLYPGSHVHITPSLVFEYVVYIDSFRNTYKFFESSEVKEFIEKNKEYDQSPTFKFYQQDYYKKLDEEENSFDLVISQYAGFVGQAVKRYLKSGGLLVCNDSHGDASMASIDSDYKLIAIYQRETDEKFSISEKNLKQYLIPKKDVPITKDALQKSQKGVIYTKAPSGYIFQKK